MFYDLATALCLAVMLLVLVSASLLCAPLIRLAPKAFRSAIPRRKADLLFSAPAAAAGPGLCCDVWAGFAVIPGI